MEKFKEDKTLDCVQCDQIGQLFKCLAKKLLTKVAQKSVDFFGFLIKHYFLSKHYHGNILGNVLKKFGLIFIPTSSRTDCTAGIYVPTYLRTYCQFINEHCFLFAILSLPQNYIFVQRFLPRCRRQLLVPLSLIKEISPLWGRHSFPMGSEMI